MSTGTVPHLLNTAGSPSGSSVRKPDLKASTTSCTPLSLAYGVAPSVATSARRIP